jgi:hypothetical protein
MADIKRLFLWRAWTADGRIADCGDAWAIDEGHASGVAAMALGGPHAAEVVRFQIVPVHWPSAPHGRQVTTRNKNEVRHGE